MQRMTLRGTHQAREGGCRGLVEGSLDPLKIGYLIGALNAGGSERQVVSLASGMAERGHEVEVFCYDGPGDFDAFARERGVTVLLAEGGSRLAKIRAVRRWVRALHPQLVHGFMKRASSLAVLANVPWRRFRVVGTDFSTATYDPSQPALRMALQLFRFADRVATQTEVNRQSLIGLAPWLTGKVDVVRNGVDVDRFRPGSGPDVPLEPFRFLCVGTVWRAKNPVNLVRAVAILRDRVGRSFQVVWVGRFRRGDEAEIPEYTEAAGLVGELGLEDVVSFPGPTDRVEEAYHGADALLHVSIQDGIPNAVVEGMASGLPVVVSPVSDLPLIVEEGENGFVADDFDAPSIARAMEQMLKAPAPERGAMGHRSRELAKRWFGMDRFVSEYEALYRTTLSRRV